MTVHRSLALALVAGIVGAFIGRAVPRNAPSPQVVASASSTPSSMAPADHGCKAERAELGSTKAQLAICMAFGTRTPETASSGASELSPPEPPEFEPPSITELRNNRERLESYSEAVVVQHTDGTVGVYKPDEWPIDGDGIIVARKLPSGQLGWYAGPDAGPRSDPAAFRRPNLPKVVPPSFVYQPDGTITVNGEPASPAVQRMFGGKVDPEKP